MNTTRIAFASTVAAALGGALTAASARDLSASADVVRYRVMAEFGGITRGGSVDVKQGAPASLFLHWPRDAV